MALNKANSAKVRLSAGECAFISFYPIENNDDKRKMHTLPPSCHHAPIPVRCIHSNIRR